MQTAKIPNQKIAIVGIDAYFSAYQSLDAFERSVYEGKPLTSDLQDKENNAEHSVLSEAEIIQKFDRVTDTALQDAGINKDGVTIIVVSNSQLDSSLTKAYPNTIKADSVVRALAMASKLLVERQVEAVLVCGVDFNTKNQAVGAVVLKYETAKRDRIYAAIDRSTEDSSNLSEISYLEILSDKPLAVVGEAIASTHSTRSCAVSSVTNAGYSGIAAGIASLIKTVLCLYYRYIPPVPQWTNSTNLERQQIYVVAQAKPWFLEAGVGKRVAAIELIDEKERIILSEETAVQKRSNAYLEQTPYYLFPLAAPDAKSLIAQLEKLQQTLDSDLAKAARQTFSDYQNNSEAAYALAILGRNKPELLREIDRAIQGIPKSLSTGKDWQTPVGSYFTASPLGKKGKVAYVYPSAYNAHLGLGRNLFRLFPNLIDDPVIQSTCDRIASLEKLLYPRSWKKLSPRELEILERKLLGDPLAMLESETGFAGLITAILRNFQLRPQGAFGYSLGEVSMMYAQGVWSDFNRSSDLLSTSPLFKTRLAGNKDAVREHWQLSSAVDGELWRTYVLMANSELVRERLQQEARVYLTQISTPNEAIIAGDPQGCERVINSLGCDAFRAPFNHVIHCKAMSSEYEELMKLNTQPIQNVPDVTFYSAANYEKIPINTPEIARSLSQTLCQQLDFPRLVNRVYRDDFRIFVEVGAGSNCSRWIKDILKSQAHATISLHRRGTDDFTSLIKALAKLVSQRVELDLSPLYGQRRSRTTGDRENFEPTAFNVTNSNKLDKILLENNSSWLGDRDKNTPQVPKVKSSSIGVANDISSSLPLQSIPKASIQKTKSRTSSISKSHSIFIKNERKYLKNSQKMIQIQTEFLQQIIKG